MMRTGYILIVAAVLAACAVSCAEKEPAGEAKKQTESLYGFHLGEPRSDLFARVGHKVSWTRLSGNKWDYRGELFRFDGPLDGTEGIAFLRVAFFEGRLFEIIAYYEDASPMMLDRLKRELEDRYGGTMVAPDGTKEMAYKTYWLSTPDKSITLRRITKQTGIELYVQYMHKELHNRLIKRKLEMQSE